MRKNAYQSILIVIVGIFVLLMWCSCKQETETDSLGKGYALAIGLNQVNPEDYAGWSGDLTGCEPDARDMKSIATEQGFIVETLLTAQATREAVLDRIHAYAGSLQNGDLLVVSYSGHGGQIPDQNGDEDDDGLDETWCLYNGELLDDELFEAWTKFRDGVRILVFSDSCHSGTVLKMKRSDWDNRPQIERFDNDWKLLSVPQKLKRTRIMSFLEQNTELRSRIKSLPALKKPIEKREPTDPDVEVELFFSRSMPPLIMMMTYEQNKQFYIDIGMRAPKEDPNKVKASMILISGCEDNQTSADLGFNGLFTWKLKQVWDNGNFSGNHREFHETIKEQVLQMNEEQSPNFFTPRNPDELFAKQRPYSADK